MSEINAWQVEAKYKSEHLFPSIAPGSLVGDASSRSRLSRRDDSASISSEESWSIPSLFKAMGELLT
jgi:hypothetical protein